MGAEEAAENRQQQHQDSLQQIPNPVRITVSQFLNWKRQKVLFFFLLLISRFALVNFELVGNLVLEGQICMMK